MPKVSVIIPVYNAAPYIERCARSLFGQTLDDMEFVFVDDCSTDNSIQIVQNVLKDFPSRYSQVKFLMNEKNLGQAATRNTGLRHAVGDYIIHCDSDDWVEPDMYEQLYTAAIEQKADIATCDYYLEYPNRTQMNKRGLLSCCPHDAITDNKSRPFYSCWCHLVKRDVIVDNKVFYVQGINMWEDILAMMKIFYYSKRIAYVEKPLYHYNKCNVDSITVNNTFSDNNLEQQSLCVKNLEDFFADKNDIDFLNTALMLKKMIRDRYLYQNPPNYKKWRECYPEAADVNLAFENPNWIYRAAYEIAKRGIFFPLKSYRFLSHLIRSNKN